MNDLFGHVIEPAPFVDIRNTRESVAEEKARLCMELNGLLKTPPQSLGAASIQTVRAFKYAHKTALKVFANKTSSRGDLQSAISSMRAFE